MKSITKKHHDTKAEQRKLIMNKQHPNPYIILLHYVQLGINRLSVLSARCDRNLARLARTADTVSRPIHIVASSTNYCNDFPNSNDLIVYIILASSDVLAVHSTWGHQMSSMQLQMKGYYFMGVFKVTLSKVPIILQYLTHNKQGA